VRSRSVFWVPAASLLAACASASPPEPAPFAAALAGAGCPPPIGTAITPDGDLLPGRLCGRLRFPSGQAASTGTGTAVVAWYRPEEQARFRAGRFLPLELLPALFDRARVVSGIRPGGAEGVEYALDYPGGEAVVLAVADFQHLFWEALLGGQAPGNSVGASALVTAAPRLRHADPRCTRNGIDRWRDHPDRVASGMQRRVAAGVRSRSSWNWRLRRSELPVEVGNRTRG
jgi:hypothetical protein